MMRFTPAQRAFSEGMLAEAARIPREKWSPELAASAENLRRALDADARLNDVRNRFTLIRGGKP